MSDTRLAQVAQAYPEIQAAGAELLGVGRFTLESAQATKDEHSLPFPLCPDPDGLVVDHYSGTVNSSMSMARAANYIINQNGVIAFERVEDGTVEPATTTEILQALARLEAEWSNAQ